MKRDTHSAHLSALPMPDRDHIEGPIDAPIKLVEYGDCSCEGSIWDGQVQFGPRWVLKRTARNEIWGRRGSHPYRI